jgi:TRAP-type mannitol/chloroaromatic compound transport system substrate-binding protein
VNFLKVGTSAGGGVLAASIAAPAIAQTQPEIKWRIASSLPKSLDSLYGAADFMVKRRTSSCAAHEPE